MKLRWLSQARQNRRMTPEVLLWPPYLHCDTLIHTHTQQYTLTLKLTLSNTQTQIRPTQIPHPIPTVFFQKKVNFLGRPGDYSYITPSSMWFYVQIIYCNYFHQDTESNSVCSKSKTLALCTRL